MSENENDIASAVAEAAASQEVEDDVELEAVAGDVTEEVEDAPEAEEAAQEAAEETPPEGEEVAAELEALEAPEHWNEAYREAFGKVDRDTQEAWLEQQKDFQRGFDRISQEYKQHQERFSPVEAVMPLLEQAAPYWQAQGMGVEQGLGQLMQWGYYLAQDPAAAIPQIAKLYGVELGELANEQPYLTPDEQRQQQLLEQQNQELGSLRSRLDQQEYERTLDLIGSFRNEVGADGNPLHPYFDQVQGEVTRMYQNGYQGELKDAYEQAVWTNAEVRAELIKAEQTGAVQDVVQQNTEAARRAQGKAKQRVRHTRPGQPQGTEVDEMTTEQLVAHLAHQQEAGAAG